MIRRIIGLAFAIIGFIGLFAECESLAGFVLLKVAAIALFAAGIAILGGFKEEIQPIKHNTL